MTRNTSSFPSSIFVSNSSFDGPIWVPAPIVSLREAPKNEGGLLNNILFAFSNRDVDRLHDTYHTLRESFQIFASSTHVYANDLIPAGNTIIVFEE